MGKGVLLMRESLAKAVRRIICIFLLLAFAVAFSPLAK